MNKHESVIWADKVKLILWGLCPDEIINELVTYLGREKKPATGGNKRRLLGRFVLFYFSFFPMLILSPRDNSMTLLEKDRNET